MGNTVQVKVDWPDEATTILQDIKSTDRYLGLKDGLRKGGKIVVKRAKELCPKPGYPGDKPDLIPLENTIGMEVRGYNYTIMVICGPRYPAGAHGHLVEFGHQMVLWGDRIEGGFVEPHPFMRPAADETKSQQESAIVDHLRDVLKKQQAYSIVQPLF